jgi:TatD DNase family protein
MVLIDTHAHLYGDQFDSDIDKVLQRAYHSGVEKIFLPAIDSETHDRLLKLAASEVPPNANTHRPSIYPMMGVHPCSINEKYKEELDIAWSYLNNGVKYYAVGEIGLDFYWDVTYRDQQFEAFETQIGWAMEKGLPIVIHARKSTYDCIGVVKKYKGKVNGIFHCFSGSAEEARRVDQAGILSRHRWGRHLQNSGLQELLKEIDLTHIVLETDAPYLTPVPYRGKGNESSYTRIVCEEVARIKGLSLTAVAEVTTANAMKVFQI